MNYAEDKAKANKWFENQGKMLPEVNLHITEEERENYRKQALEGHVCEWFQMGNRIICQAGENEHGKIISPTKMLKETRDGQPILQDYVISS